MPLPNAGATWPPKPLQCVYDRVSVWDAWHSGEPDRLSAVYGGMVGSDPTGTGFFASQEGGWRATVNKAIQRWFWGQRPQNQRRTKLHVPLAGDIAAASAGLLFSEMPTLTVDDATTQDRLDALTDDDMHSTLLEAAELSAALGGGYLRVCWDVDVADKPFLGAVHADAAVPDFRYGRLAAVTFWRLLSDDGTTIVRHLERHEVGVILHGVYAGTRTNLGKLLDQAAWPSEMAGIDPVVQTGVPQLTAVYIPNIRPNRLWRHIPAAAPLGRADIQAAEGMLDSLDEVYTSWMRDIRIGKGRLVVPRAYIQDQGKGKGGSFDPDQEVYEAINSLPTPGDGGGITNVQFAIRVQEHHDTASALMQQIVRGAGYNMSTFGEQDNATASGPVTATEVHAREARSLTTRAVKIGYIRPRLAEMLETLLAVDAAVFHSGVTPAKPDLEWPDAVAPDPQQQAQTLQLLDAAQAASTQTRVEMLHPDWDEQQVAEEVQRIGESQPKPPPSIDGMFSQPPEPDEQQQPGEPEPEQ